MKTMDIVELITRPEVEHILTGEEVKKLHLYFSEWGVDISDCLIPGRTIKEVVDLFGTHKYKLIAMILCCLWPERFSLILGG